MSRAHYFLVANVLVNNIDDSKIILVPGAFPSEIKRKALGTWLQQNSAINICVFLCKVTAEQGSDILAPSRLPSLLSTIILLPLNVVKVLPSLG